MKNLFDQSLADKAVVIREGAALRTAEELVNVFTSDVADLVDCERPPEDQICTCGSVLSEIDRHEVDGLCSACHGTMPEYLSEVVQTYSDRLSAAGYTDIWNDGYVIYVDLTEEELDYLQDF